VVAAFGTEKAGAVHEALFDRGSRLPLARALHGARRAVVLLDHAAAGR
jgi:hypothetical protein